MKIVLFLALFLSATVCQSQAPSALDKRLLQAVEAKDLGRTRALLKQGANPSASYANLYNSTALMLTYGNVALSKTLLQAGTDPNQRDRQGYTLLMNQCRNRLLILPILKMLIEYGADVSARDDRRKTALMWASAITGYGGWGQGKPLFSQVAKALLAAGADIESADEQGRTALLLAANGQHTDAVTTLIGLGANIEARDKQGQTALLLSCEVIVYPATSSGSAGFSLMPCAETVESLLKGGAKINARDGNGETALIRASKIPVNSPLSKNTPDELKALLHRQQKETLAVANTLIKGGADVSAVITNGNTALKWAKMRGNRPLVELLENAGAK